MQEDRRKRKSRAALRGALMKLMEQRSPSQITIKALCETADVNRSTFYANYGTIEDLLSDIHAEFFHRIELLLPERREPETDPHHVTEAEFLRIIGLMAAPDSPLPLLLRDDDARLFVQNMVQHFMTRYVLTHASCAGHYSYTYRTIGSFTVITQWIREGMPCPAQELAALLSSMSADPIL
ncbi:MAG: TetR/AcrR family transcriptional regulator [Clostridia bacterium]|nr:TetR/AcrR family transcriptional regulator [Clostridia bacterium]